MPFSLVLQVEDAVPQIMEGVQEIEDTWGAKLETFGEELADMATDLTMIESAISAGL